MNYNKKPSQKGFTLIEIMIALTIGLFLSAGAVQIFLGTKNTNRTQENLSRMQENARFAMFFITEDIRKVGFDGAVCGRGEMLDQAINRLDTSSAQHQFSTRVLIGQAPLFASLSDAIGGTDNTGVNGSDSITIRKLGAITGVKLIAPLAASTDDLQINASEAGAFDQGGIVLVTDCFYSDIFQITDNPAGGILKHETGSSEVPDNKTDELSHTYGTNARVYPLTAAAGLAGTTYSISNGTGSLGLAQQVGVAIPQQLVPDIENMQILYGQRTTAGDTFYVPAGTAGLIMNEVISVRISLLVRSPDDFIATTPQAYFFDGVDVSGAAIPDRRLRKVYTTTITGRNFVN